MSVLQLLIILAVLATLYWAAGHHTPTNHAEQDEAASRGVQHGSTRASLKRSNT